MSLIGGNSSISNQRSDLPVRRQIAPRPVISMAYQAVREYAHPWGREPMLRTDTVPFGTWESGTIYHAISNSISVVA
jgi:hypothetical protein